MALEIPSVRESLRRALCALLALCLMLAAGHVAADERADAKAEARERFYRGLRLFDQGDDAGALAEFQRAHELTGHPLLLYNIGLVYAAMKRPVEAVDTLDKLLAAPGDVDAAKLERAKRTRSEQAQSIGRLMVVSNVSGASVEVDGVLRGKTPLALPIRLARGTHIVGVVAPSHLPERREVLIASGGVTRLDFQLAASDARLARLEIPLSLPGVEVRVDGERVATTPLPAPLTIAPGKHQIELGRPGYRTLRRNIDIGPGTSGRIDGELAIDAAALGREGGTLAVEVSEPNATIWLDGAPVGATIRAPHGEHQLAVERAGFLRVERSVEIPRGSTGRVWIELEPTPETRAAYVDRTTSQRSWGYVALGAGVLIAGGSAGFLIYNASEESDAKDAYERAADKFDKGGECDPSAGLATAACEKELTVRQDQLESVRDREVFGWIGLGTGAAIAGLGAYLLISNDDPERYEPGPESEQIGKVRAFPTASALPGGFSLGVVGTF